MSVQKQGTSRESARMRQTEGLGRRPSSAPLQQEDLLLLQRAITDPGAASPADILAIQRRYGNRAVSGLIQAKLTVGAVGDVYEQEADRVAEQVLDMPAPAGQQRAEPPGSPVLQRQVEDEEEELQAKPLAASITPLIQRQEDEEEELQLKPLTPAVLQRQVEDEEEELQLKPLAQRQIEEEEEIQMRTGEADAANRVQADGSFEASSDLEARLAEEKGSGSPLPPEVRSFMEPRFGADFSSVRVHTDAQATQLNRQLSSRAFTHGNDIYFSASEYDPETPDGTKLLAHELTHTLQQGAANRISGWWPTGHRLVTEQAFAKGDFDNVYAEDAQKYLIARSPDIDFIQDQGITMDEGIKLGKDRIETYESLIAAGQDERAKQMWENNELHWREPAYMMSHGEGGRYKEADPAAINEAMTYTMVSQAASGWDWTKPGSNMEALSRLSDALHQAEDRGSHDEGRAFGGHDARLMVKKWAQDHDRDLQPWEKWINPPPEAITGKWAPDNFSVNKRGGILGVGFAIGALKLFAHLIDQPGARQPISLNPDENSPTKRAAKFKKFLPFAKSGNILGKVIGKSGKGWTPGRKRKALEKILANQQELILTGQLGEEEFAQSQEMPRTRELQEAQVNQLVKGWEFYETGAGFQDEFQKAETKFREWGKSRFRKGGKKKSERIRLAKAYFVERTAKVKDDPNALAMVGNSILKAYEQVFGNRLYPAGQTPWEQLNKMGIQ